MKKILFLSMIISLIIVSCVQKVKESEKVAKIENTLISVALFKDSLGVDPSKFLSILERRNKAIDTMGYPDAGYQLWLIQGDSNKDFRFMSIGSWPNQAIYDTIHHNKIFLKNATLTPEEEKMFMGIKQTTYNRFTVVK
jgi:hypothetical protein